MFTDASWLALATELARDPRSVQTLLREHTCRRDGHCAACGSHSVPPPIWPCKLFMLAQAADRMVAGHVEAGGGG